MAGHRAASLILFCMMSAPNAFAHSRCACSAAVTGNGVVDGADFDHLGNRLFGAPVNGCEGADVDGDVDYDDAEAWGCLDGGAPADLCCAYILGLSDFPMTEAEGPSFNDHTGRVAL
ncbi:MAG: hypothetical protein KJ749_11575 [Planctomycetes bacterium]|nr:hypothetical protein [Planctomycetota bacterium]